MKQACPTCRRRFGVDDLQCRRCGTDLQLVQKVLTQVAALVAKGKLLLQTQPTEAEVFIRQALAINPQNPEVKKTLALALLLQSRFAEAMTYL